MGTMKGGDGRRNGVRQRQDCAAGHNLNNTALRIIPPLLDTELDTEVALFDMPNYNRYNILSISIFCKIPLSKSIFSRMSISISITIFSRMTMSIAISIFFKLSLSISIPISIFSKFPYPYFIDI